MESKPGPFIGILFDHTIYVNVLRRRSKFNLVHLPLSLVFTYHDNSLKEFEYNNEKLNFIIVYSSINNVHRQDNYGLEWMKNFRLAGFNTPIIVLTWQSTEIIENKYCITDSFMISNQSKALKILQLPVTLGKIHETMKLLSPLTDKEFQNQIRQLKIWEMSVVRHDLRNIVRASEDLWNMKREIINYFNEDSRKVKYNSFLQELLRCSCADLLIEKIESFK